MPYLLRKNPSEILLIDYNLRTGLFYKSFVMNQFSRVYPILNSSTELYCAVLDYENKIHIACKNKRNQIVHIYEKNNKLVNEILLDDSNNVYQLTNFNMMPGEKSLHLFYTAVNPTQGNPEIIHHIVNKNNTLPPQSFSPISDLNGYYDCISHEKNIYFTSTIQDTDSFIIFLHQFDEKENQWIKPKELVKSKFPISYWKLCIDRNNHIHLIYIQDQYGQYRLNYINLTEDTDQPLYSSAYELRPTLFVYHGSIWINWLENNRSKAILSIDSGKTFSKPVSTTLQSEKFLRYHYFYDQSFVHNLQGNEFFGYEGDYPTLTILDRLDMDNIHVHLPANTELKSYIEFIGKMKNQENETLKNDVLEENNRLKSVQDNISTQYNQLAQFARQLQQEGKKWKSKYYDLEKKYTEMKKGIKKSASKNIVTSTSLKESIAQTNLSETNNTISTNTTEIVNPKATTYSCNESNTNGIILNQTDGSQPL